MYTQHWWNNVIKQCLVATENISNRTAQNWEHTWSCREMRDVVKSFGEFLPLSLPLFKLLFGVCVRTVGSIDALALHVLPCNAVVLAQRVREQFPFPRHRPGRGSVVVDQSLHQLFSLLLGVGVRTVHSEPAGWRCHRKRAKVRLALGGVQVVGLMFCSHNHHK